jgi:hypothetical protein
LKNREIQILINYMERTSICSGKNKFFVFELKYYFLLIVLYEFKTEVNCLE